MRGRGGFGKGFGKGRGMGFGRGLAPISAMPPPIPPIPDTMRVATATIDNRGLESIISPRFARAPYIVLIDIRNGSIVNTHVIPNPVVSAPSGAGVAIAQWLISCGVKKVIATNIGYNAYEILKQAGISIHTIQPGIRVIDALRFLGLVKG